MSGDKTSTQAPDATGFFKRDVAEPTHRNGPQTSEEWWDYLCAQADARRQKQGLPTGDMLIDWRQQVIVPRRDIRPLSPLLRRRGSP